MRRYPNTVPQNGDCSVHVGSCGAASAQSRDSRWAPRFARVVVFVCVMCLACIMVSSCERNGRTEDNVKEHSVQPPNDASGTSRTTAKMKPRLELHKIKFSIQLTKKQFLADWGPPDAIEGSGVQYLVYELDDGRSLWLLFASQAPQPLLKARVYDDGSDTDGRTVFDGMNDTQLR
jgi:hypothetical protein